VKLGLVGGRLDGGLQALSYVGARATPAAFGPRLLAKAARRGALEVGGWEGPGESLATLRRVVVLGDGAPGIWDLEAEPFGERVEVVDVSHAADHVWAIAHALCGEGPTFAALAREYAGRPAC
jgi:hypothetical protein